MAHYAFLDNNNVVTHVIVGRDETDRFAGVADWEEWYANEFGQTCKRTSYNTHGGVHVEGGVPFRGNYARRGFIYNDTLDAFIPPQPYPSWMLNETTCLWDAPVAHPNDDLLYTWDEASQSWQEVTDGN